MGEAMRVAVVIPARNEALAIGRVISGIPRELIHEVIVVDNGSTDRTAEVAAAAGARVVAEPRAGYGRACHAGVAALSPGIDTVVFMDGDHADDPEDLPRLLKPIRDIRAELVIGSRVAQAEAGSLTPQQRAGNRLACALMRWLFGHRYTDLGPFRAIRRDALARLGMRDQAFGWTVEMQARAAALRLRIEEVPVRYRPRIGRSKISGTVGGSIRAGLGILSTIARVASGADPDGRRRVLIFLKQPSPGQVKTRLAASLGPEAAAGIYRACAQLTLERLRPLQAEAVLCVDPPEGIDAVARWVGPGWRLEAQRGRTLGDRLAHATRSAFAEGARRVIVIGTDSPWLAARDIEMAFDALASSEVVLGPAEDGGYYLIGLSRDVPALFDAIAWSSSAVYDQTLAKATALGLSCSALKAGYDVDRLEDLQRFIAEEQAQGRSTSLVEALAHHGSFLQVG